MVAFAANEPQEKAEIEISAVDPNRMTNIESAVNRLSIRNGVASIRAYVYGYSGSATKCEVTVNLQVKSLGLFWTSSSDNGWDLVGSDGGTYARVRR